MGVLFTNNAIAVIGAAIDAASTVLTVQPGYGVRYPQPVGTGDWFPLTLVDYLGNMEIVRCTARSGDTMTVVRGQEGTAARAFPLGSRVDHRLTADALEEIALTTYVGDVPPANPSPRQLWYQNTTGNTYIYYDDGDSRQWVQIAPGSGVEPGGSGRVWYSRDFAGTTIADRINAAVALAVDGDTIDANEGGAHDVTTTITLDQKALTLRLGTTKLNVKADIKAIKAYCLPNGPWALSADYVIGSLTIPMNAMDRAPIPGEWFMIYSEAIDPANRDRGTEDNQYRCGEKFQAYGGTTTSITLKRPLRFVKGVEMDGSIKIDAFTLAKNARVLRFVDLPLAVEGGIIEYEAGHSGSWASSAVDVRGWSRPRVQGIKVLLGYASAFNLGGNIDGDFRDLGARNLPPDFGYGISVGGDMRSRIKGLVGWDNRHTVTDNSLTRTIGTSTKELIIVTGRSVGTLVEGCASHGSSSSAFDTHHGASDWTFRDNFVGSGNSWAISLRGQGHRVDGLTARNCANGVQVFTEYHSGNVGDEYYVSGKPEGLSFASVGNLDIECDSRVLNLSGAKVKIYGHNRLVTKDWQTIAANSSYVEVYGSIDHQVVAPAIDNVGKGIFWCDPTIASLGADFAASLIFMPNSHVKVDATAAISSGACSIFDTVPNAFITMRGTMDLVLPNFVIEKFSTNITGTNSTLCITHGDDQRMQITGPGAALLDKTRRGYAPSHYALNDKSNIVDIRAMLPGLADDTMGTFAMNLLGGFMEIFMVDYRSQAPNFNQPVGCTILFLDPTASSSEVSAILVNDTNAMWMMVPNTDLTTANVTDGKIGITYKDGAIQIMARLGQASPLTALFKGWGSRL